MIEVGDNNFDPPPPKSKLDFWEEKGVKLLKSAKNLTKSDLTQISREGQDQ